MTPFALTVTWGGRPVTAVEAERCLDGISFRCGDGRKVVVVPGAAAAVGLRTTVLGEELDNGLAVNWEERWIAAGDVRLYDRSSLLAALGGRELRDQSDIALLARAYRRFGAGILASAAGDFALVIWDWHDRRLHAIRDHFGVRPVFYRVASDRMTFATDARQLIGSEGDEATIDSEKAIEYLATRFSSTGHTFYSEVKSVLPAHCLLAGDGYLNQNRYWEPSFALRPGSYADHIEEWRHRFRVAVRDRLRSNRPVAAYLSGGLDSSSIVGAANDVLSSDEDVAGAARPLALSALFPGFPCDERPYIEAVLRRCPTFDSFTWDGREENPRDFEDPDLVAPGLRQGIGRSPRRENDAMAARDCRVVLTGDGGDALSSSYGWLADLGLAGKFLTLFREFTAIGSWRRVARVFRTEATMALPQAKPPSPPAWLSPDLREAFESGRSRGPSFKGPSRMQSIAWRAICGPANSYVTDMVVEVGSASGIEVRMPYFDVRLVELVLSIPWQDRLPRGDFRRLQRDASAPFLPDTVRDRFSKASFNCMLAHQLRTNLPRIEALLRDRNWASGRFVNQTVARKDFESLAKDDPRISRPIAWRHIWKIGSFEAWLRRVFGYDAVPKGAT